MSFSNNNTALEQSFDKATNPSQAFENWEYIMDACDKVNDDPVNGPSDSVKIIQGYLESGDNKRQKFALVVLSSLAQNCGPLMHKEIASKSLTGSLLELGTDPSASESLRQQVFEVMETLAREFRSDPSLKEVEIAFNRLKQTDPSIIPPAVPQKHQITDEDRRKEEEELQRVLALSLEESQEDPRYNDFGAYGGSGSSGFASSGNINNNTYYNNNANTNNNAYNNSNAHNNNNSGQNNNSHGYNAGPGQNTNPFTNNSATNNARVQQQQQQQPQINSDANLLDLDDTPQSSAPKTASSVRAVRAIYDLTSTEAGELTFRRGDIIVVIESVYRDWWKGSLRGEVGIFPLNYVEPLEEPTNEEAVRESREEQSLFAEFKKIEKVLSILNDAHKQNPAPKISENQELQELYNSTQAVRPKLTKILEKLNQKRDELTDLDNRLLSARRAYDELLEGSLSSINQPAAHSDTNPFQGQMQQPPQQGQLQQPQQFNTQPKFNTGPQQQQQGASLQLPNAPIQPQLSGSHLQTPASPIPTHNTGGSSHFQSSGPVNMSAQLTGPSNGGLGGPPLGSPQGLHPQQQPLGQAPFPQQSSFDQGSSSFSSGGRVNNQYSGPPPTYSPSEPWNNNNNNNAPGGNSQPSDGFQGIVNGNNNTNNLPSHGFQSQQHQGYYSGNNSNNY